jgi:hypothetical protein
MIVCMLMHCTHLSPSSHFSCISSARCISIEQIACWRPVHGPKARLLLCVGCMRGSIHRLVVESGETNAAARQNMVLAMVF